MTEIVKNEMSIRQLHNSAMDFAERAMFAEREGNHTAFLDMNLQAYYLEKQAAEAAVVIGSEPTKSILLRSAATLALECKMIRESERLISTALAGDPPNEIAEELRDLLEKVSFERHLNVRGITLQSGELQISMTGDEVSFGMMPSSLAIERIQDTEALLLRTAERKAGIPYRKSGRPKNEILDMFNVYMSTPRAASFALTLRIGATQAIFGQQDDIVSEVIECMKLVNENKIDALQEKITDTSYYNNFLGLTRKIAPDGKKIKMVGFTSKTGDTEQTAMLTTPQKDIIQVSKSLKKFDVGSGDLVKIQGLLGFADKFRRDEIIKVQPSVGQQRTVYVPEGLMDDVVRPHWGKQVVVTGHEDTNTGIITLSTIESV